MSPTPRAESTRKHILGAAQRCFAARGFAATTTREIARAAGVTQPLLHHYFGSKQALFDAVLEASVLDYDQVQGAQWDLPLGDVRFLTKGLVVMFRWIGAHPELLRLAAWGRLEGKFEAAPRTMQVFERVQLRFEHAKAAGVLRADIDVDIAMLMIEALFKGYWDRRGLLSLYPIDTNDLDRRYLDAALRMVIRELLSEEAAVEALETLDSWR